MSTQQFSRLSSGKNYAQTKYALLLLAVLQIYVIAPVPAKAQSIDYFFNRTAGGTTKKSTIAPFPSFPSAADLQSKASDKPLVPGSASDLTKQAVLVWFEKYDDMVFTLGCSDREKYIIKRPINKEVERLNEWIAAVTSLAQKYRSLAKRIRSLRPPQADLKELQSESADWYDDNAQLCEELIAPRPPAKTYEELERAYKGFVTRSKNLAEVSKSVTELSTKLRQRYDVHQPKYVDESAKFIDSVTHNLKGS